MMFHPREFKPKNTKSMSRNCFGSVKVLRGFHLKNACNAVFNRFGLLFDWFKKISPSCFVKHPVKHWSWYSSLNRSRQVFRGLHQIENIQTTVMKNFKNQKQISFAITVSCKSTVFHHLNDPNDPKEIVWTECKTRSPEVILFVNSGSRSVQMLSKLTNVIKKKVELVNFKLKHEPVF